MTDIKEKIIKRQLELAVEKGKVYTLALDWLLIYIDDQAKEARKAFENERDGIQQSGIWTRIERLYSRKNILLSLLRPDKIKIIPFEYSNGGIAQTWVMGTYITNYGVYNSVFEKRHINDYICSIRKKYGDDYIDHYEEAEDMIMSDTISSASELCKKWCIVSYDIIQPFRGACRKRYYEYSSDIEDVIIKLTQLIQNGNAELVA